MASHEREADAPPEAPWLTPGVCGIGVASLLADVGHEIPTALLPEPVTRTLGGSAAVLGVMLAAELQQRRRSCRARRRARPATPRTRAGPARRSTPAEAAEGELQVSGAGLRAGAVGEQLMRCGVGL